MSIHILWQKVSRNDFLLFTLLCLNIIILLVFLKKADNLFIAPFKSFSEFFQPIKFFETENTSKLLLLSGGQQVLDCLGKGKWLQRNLTEQEEAMIGDYLVNARGEFHIPSTFQRLDGRCGDVPYVGSPLSRIMWFRSICNSKGDTPCCKNYSCLPLSTDECRCDTCLDERQAIHSEFSTWKPDDQRCDLRNFTTEQACQVLNGSTISFVGDSFVRHVYVAMVILLTGDTSEGTLRQDIDEAKKTKCRGWYQITGLTCRDVLNESRILCNNSVKVNYLEVFHPIQLSSTLPLLKQMRHIKKSLIVFALGIHDDFNLPFVASKFLWPFLNLRQFLSTNLDQGVDLKDVLTNCSWSSWKSSERKSNSPVAFRNLNSFLPTEAEPTFQDVSYNVSNLHNILNKELIFQTFPDPMVSNDKMWPRLLWLGVHAPGLIKSPKYPRRTPAGVEIYNKGIQQILHNWRVPYLNTYSFTKGVISHDGTHYGWGINMLKVNMILNYIQVTKL